MKRRIALGCLAALLAALLLTPWTAAAGPYEDVYLLGVNDTVMLNYITAELMPVRRDGSIYAPCTLLLDNKDLELSYAVNRSGGTFTVFNRARTIIFQLNRAGAVDKEGNSYPNQRVISRDGVVFFPLRFVSEFFGLNYSFYNLVLPEGTVPIARVCTPQATLSDTQFGTSAAAMAADPLRQYAESRAEAEASPSPEPSASPEATPPPDEQVAPVDVSFAVLCRDGAGFQSLLNSFAAARCSALFLFTPEDLLTRDGDVRSAAAAGHQIGLLLRADAAQEDFRLGNQRLGHILRGETNQVAFLEGGSQEGNWRVWTGNVAPRGRGADAQAANLLTDINAAAPRTARVTLNDSWNTALALSRDIRTLAQRPYTLITTTEVG